jgi:hypothetical protein
VGTSIVTAGGGGKNFVAVITSTNAVGAIMDIEILNHGDGFVMVPSAAVNNPMCMCNLEVQ